MTNFQKMRLHCKRKWWDRKSWYKYLGQRVKMDENTREKVLMRMKAGWGYFGRYKDTMWKNTSSNPENESFNQCVLPTMTYVCETWTTTTKYLEQKLRTVQYAMERRMLNITQRDEVRNSEIRNKTKVKDITEKNIKWRWAGHKAMRNDR